MTLEKTKKGLTGFEIKFLALIFMLLDHIHYFFEFTGKVPVIFSWIGRLAAGLFLFTMVEGYTYTSNKKKYFTRIYLMSVFMGIVKYLIQTLPQLQRGDGFYPANGIFSTFVILIIMFIGIDFIREKKLFKGIGLILLPFIISYSFYFLPKAIMPYAYLLVSTLIPSPLLVEGGLHLIIAGIILYIFRENRKLQGIFYGIFVLAWMLGLPLIYIRPISLKLMFTDYYEWMSVFALIFMFLYNGEKGKPMKRLFYIFYPAHIYILYTLSFLLYKFIY